MTYLAIAYIQANLEHAVEKLAINADCSPRVDLHSFPLTIENSNGVKKFKK